VAQATLLVIQGIEQGTRFEIDDQNVGIGRGVHNAVRLHDTEVSRTHATISVDNDGFVLTDRNSSNGTFVNGQHVRSVRLRDGDQIQTGRTILLFSQAAAEEASSLAVHRIDLLSRSDPGDRFAIVGQAEQHESHTFLAPAAGEAAARTRPSSALTDLQVLYRITEEVARPSTSLDQLLGRILNITIDVTRTDRGCILLRNPSTGELSVQVFANRHGSDTISPMPVSRSIVDYVLQNGQGVRTSDARHDARFAPGQSILQAGIREAICVPMQGRHELLGVIYIDITTPPEQVVIEGGPTNKLNEDLLRLVVAIGRQAALVVEHNRYQQALVKAERFAAIGQTITTLSHHIKNILQGVRGGSYLIDMGLTGHNEELVRKGWGIVEKNQDKVYNLVLDMLTFSKERQPTLQRADLNATVAEVCELMQARAAECGVKIEWQPDPQMPATMFDPEGIHRAVLNIVTNAIDAVEGSPGGAVHVRTGHDAEVRSVFVVVADNGPGIPAAQIPLLFHLFESTKGARGTGIGLSVSQKILREHGGGIAVQNTEGQGAQFTLEWSIIEEEPRPESDEVPNSRTMVPS
jgi:signal transduction histidine kinase